MSDDTIREEPGPGSERSEETAPPGTGEASDALSASEPQTSSPSPVPAPSTWPADYYAAPPALARFPRWVPVAAGVTGILFLGFLVLLGAFLQSGGLAKLIAIAIGQVQSEASTMFEDEVTTEARAAFKASLLAVRDGVADGKIELSAALPVLEEMQKAIRDGKLTSEETGSLTDTFRKIAEPAPKHDDETPTVEL